MKTLSRSEGIRMSALACVYKFYNINLQNRSVPSGDYRGIVGVLSKPLCAEWGNDLLFVVLKNTMQRSVFLKKYPKYLHLSFLFCNFVGF